MNTTTSSIIAMQENIDWIASGKIGCVFASALVKQREKIGWIFDAFELTDNFIPEIAAECWNIWSGVFPGANKELVREWAYHNGFTSERLGYNYNQDDNRWYLCTGLRYRMKEGSAWVQYFGPDSHVKTRRAPHPMLSMTLKLPAHVYAQTMIKGVLHLAHASIEFIKAADAHTLWERSFEQTKKLLHHKPDKTQAAKVTFIDNPLTHRP